MSSYIFHLLFCVILFQEHVTYVIFGTPAIWIITSTFLRVMTFSMSVRIAPHLLRARETIGQQLGRWNYVRKEYRLSSKALTSSLIITPQSSTLLEGLRTWFLQ